MPRAHIHTHLTKIELNRSTAGYPCRSTWVNRLKVTVNFILFIQLDQFLCEVEHSSFLIDLEVLRKLFLGLVDWFSTEFAMLIRYYILDSLMIHI